MKKNRYICIFGGGAIRGVVYPGAVKALEEFNVEIPAYVGSSVGAIFASLCAFGYNSENLYDLIQEFNAFMFKDINFSINDFSISKGEVFENWIREKIEQKYYGEKYSKDDNSPVTFSEANKDLYILATDIRSNQRFVFSKVTTPNFEIAKAVRISASFPGLMKPEEFEDKLLVDGDLAKSLPLWKYCGNLSDSDFRILEFRLEGNCLNMKSLVDYINTAYSSMSYFCTENIIGIYSQKDKFDYITIDTKDTLLFDLQMSSKNKTLLAEIGYETTKNYFVKTLYDKKKCMLPLYSQLFDYLHKIKIAIKKDDINNLKDISLKYFSEFKSQSENLDEVIISEVDSFLNNLLKDSKSNYFGIVKKIEDKKIYLKLVDKLINKTNIFICDFKDYIEYIDKNY